MTGISLVSQLSISFLSLYFIELFIFKYIKLNKNNLNVITTYNTNLTQFVFNKSTVYFIYLYQIIFFLTNKHTMLNSSLNSNILYIYSVIMLIIFFSVYIFMYRGGERNTKNTTSFYICLLLFFVTYLFNLIDNCLYLIIGIELIATIYYFFFLNSFNHNTTLLKYKNLISYYLWLSFFTLFFFFFSLLFLIWNAGTIEFTEMNIVQSLLSTTFKYMFIISIFWKLGVPAFHFFKLELYQFLSLKDIFIFSITSILINTYIFIFILINLNFILIPTLTFLWIIILIGNIVLLTRGIDQLTLYQFLGFSSINTWATIILLAVL